VGIRDQSFSSGGRGGGVVGGGGTKGWEAYI